MMFKKLLSVVLLITLVFTVTACGTASPEKGDGEKKITKENLKIGVIHIGDPADGSGYSYAHDQGIQAMKQNLGLKDSQIVNKLNIEDGNASKIKDAVESCIASGCNVIYGTSYGYMETMKDLAAEHKDVIFSHATGYESNDTNFNNYFGRIYQARYLAGIAAGLKSLELKSNKLGYVSAYGTELAETCSGINAFALGAQSVNPEAVVYVKTLNNWYDPKNETAFAEALIQMGCVVIAQHCDTVNPQTAAEKAGVYGCGYNSNMTIDAPKAHLTAPIWNWGVYYTAATEAVLNGKWSEFGNYYEGIKKGFVDISELSDNCVEGTGEYIKQVRALFDTDSWDVFSGVKLSFDAEGKLVKTDAALLKNNGDVVKKAGEGSIPDSEITGSMNYFVKGVELK